MVRFLLPFLFPFSTLHFHLTSLFFYILFDMNVISRSSYRLCAWSSRMPSVTMCRIVARYHQRCFSTAQDGHGSVPKTPSVEPRSKIADPPLTQNNSCTRPELDANKSLFNNSNSSNDQDDTKVSPSLTERLKLFFKRYGRMGLVVYFGISAFTFSSIYALVSMGVDMKSYLDRLGIQLPEWSEKASGAMVTYLFYKLLLPVRLSLAMLLTPPLTRYWSKMRK